MNQLCSLVTVCVLLCFSVSLATAQRLGIVDGENSFTWNVTSTGSNANQTLIDGSVVGDNDILYEEAWYLNISGDVFRLSETNAADVSISGNGTSTATVNYRNIVVGGAKFDVDLTYSIAGTGSGPTNLGINAAVTRLGDDVTPVGGSLINYFDYDINGISGHRGIYEEAPEPTISSVNQSTGNGFRRTGTNADAYDIESFPGLKSSIESGNLLDSTPNTGLIDVTAAFEWIFSLDGGETVEVEVEGSGTVETEPNGNGPAVPEPSSFIALGFLAILSMSRRKGKGIEIQYAMKKQV